MCVALGANPNGMTLYSAAAYIAVFYPPLPLPGGRAVILSTGIICAFQKPPPGPPFGKLRTSLRRRGRLAPAPLGRVEEGFLEKRNVCRC
jgi:hypothetical protein